MSMNGEDGAGPGGPDFRLLGPVSVETTGCPVDAGPPRQRSVLAALLVDAGRPVTVDALIDRVWGESPPPRARHALQSHLARIRTVLAQVAVGLARSGGGYVVNVDPCRVDVHLFTHLVERAGRSDPDLLRRALALWRGEPLADIGGPWAERVRAAWQQQRIDAVIAWASAELDAGRPNAAIATVAGLLDEHPLVEPLAATLIRLLHAAG